MDEGAIELGHERHAQVTQLSIAAVRDRVLELEKSIVCPQLKGSRSRDAAAHGL